MTDNVIYLHGKPREIAQITRVGFREHGMCEQLLDRMGNIEFPAEAKFRSGSRQDDLFQERSS